MANDINLSISRQVFEADKNIYILNLQYLIVTTEGVMIQKPHHDSRYCSFNTHFYLYGFQQMFSPVFYVFCSKFLFAAFRSSNNFVEAQQLIPRNRGRQPMQPCTITLFVVPTSHATQDGGIDTLKSIPGLLKRLQIRAQSSPFGTGSPIYCSVG